MDEVKVGLVGYGLAGKAFHAPLIRFTPGLTLAAVVSSDAAKVRADLPDVPVVPDLDALLADPSIDLVVLATPDTLHASQALAALDAGRHVLVDKPFAPTLDLAAQRDGAATPDWFHAVLRYDRLRVILHSGALVPAPDLRFAVHGTRGSFVKHGFDRQEASARAGGSPADADWGVDPRPGMLTRASGNTEEVAGVRGDYPAFYAALREAVLGRGPDPVPPEQALLVMELLELGLESASERRELNSSLPLAGGKEGQNNVKLAGSRFGVAPDRCASTASIAPSRSRGE